jgi:hypothetical protein
VWLANNEKEFDCEQMKLAFSGQAIDASEASPVLAESKT